MEEIKNASRILILTGGHIEESFLREHWTANIYDMVIAADRGLMIADQLGIPVDYVVGDFDSLAMEIFDKYVGQNTVIESYPSEKDYTDTEIAIEKACSFNPKEIIMFGATGSRFDHSLANIHLLLKLLKRGIYGELLNQNNRIYLKDGSFDIVKEKQHGDYVSFLPFGETIEDFTLEGFKYPLYNARIIPGETLCISNELLDDIGKVRYSRGVIIVFETKD